MGQGEVCPEGEEEAVRKAREQRRADMQAKNQLRRQIQADRE